MTPIDMALKQNLIESGAEIEELLRATKRIAVVGIKTAGQSNRPAYYVPEYMQRAGYEIVPVPVYFPEATSILGEPVYRTVAAVPGGIDMVNIFRRSGDVPAHLEDILAARPRSVWMQSGIRNDEAAEQLAAAGIKVVQNRCLMIEHGRIG